MEMVTVEIDFAFLGTPKRMRAEGPMSSNQGGAQEWDRVVL